MSELQKLRVLNTIGLLLLFLASGLAFLCWQKSNRTESEHNRQGAEMQGLELEKSMIERELDSLILSYRAACLENEGLHGKVAGTAERVDKNDAAIRNLKTRNRRDPEALRKQVEELRKIRLEYETIIATVRSENGRLRAANQQ